MTLSEAAALEAPLAAPLGAAASMAEPEQQQPPKPATPGVDAAFEVWLNRGLHELYDAVAREPVPQALLDLIEQDRAAKDNP